MDTKTQDNERAQLLQTVEMFEAVTQANADDYQSLEILKEAYVKLGRDEDILRVSKQIARAHFNVGQVSQAILQYEGLLQKYPNDSEAVAALKELEQRAMSGGSMAPGSGDGNDVAARGNGSSRTSATGGEAVNLRLGRIRPHADDQTPDGDEFLCELVMKHGMLKEKDVTQVLHAVQANNVQLAVDAIRLTLVQAFSDRGLLSPDQLLAFITEKANLPYIPLSIYDVVPDIVRLLPRDIAFKFSIMPFDRIGRTLMVATTNPFDERAKKSALKVLDYSVHWYVCAPGEISQVLKDVYMVGKATVKVD